MEEDYNEEYENQGEGFREHFRKMEKEMLKIDLSRGGVMPLNLLDFIDLFGQPTEEDLNDITQAYLKQYHQHGEDVVPAIVEAYGDEWVTHLLSHNESIEEYELCAILKEHLDVYKQAKTTP